MTLHILLDPSGAYLCLEHSLACSHLESLLERVAARAERTISARPELWAAFAAGKAVEAREGLEVRETQENLIHGRM